MRLDRALAHDLREALRRWPVRLYLLVQLVAGVGFILRRGPETASTVVLIWLGLLVLWFTCWWAGRHPRARPRPDPVPQAAARTVFALLAVAGLTVVGFGASIELGLLLLVLGFGGWAWSAVRAGDASVVRERLARDARPFLPLLLLVGLPKLLALGPVFLLGAVLSLPSGLGQQLLFLLGLYAPLEAVTRQSVWAAVLAALAFALVHVPLVVEANEGDLLAAMANAVVWQSGVGLAAVLAYRRHRAVVPIGVAHALAIG